MPKESEFVVGHMKKLLALYRERIGNRFFLRLMIIYSAIIVVMISVMGALISKGVKVALMDQAVNHNMQVLETIHARFIQQNRNFKKILSGLYSGTMKGGPEGKPAVQAIEELFDPFLADKITFSEELDVRRELDTYRWKTPCPLIPTLAIFW